MSFNDTREIKACRKARRCYWCDEKIEVGQPAVRVTGVWDGDFGQCFWHPECNTVFISLTWQEREADGLDDAFEPGQYKRGSKEPKR